LPHRSHPVAGIAVRDRVGPDQGKAILMLVNGMNGNLPAIHAVAKVALRAILAPMDIGVAVLAIGADVGKHWIDVAFLAAHLDVHTPQRISGLAVIELRLGTNRPPGGSRVAVFAGDVQPPMWALVWGFGWVFRP
jgi:hypothetical protein